MKRIVKKIEPIITLIVWSAIIFYFSSIPGLRSTHTTDFIDFILRKAAHITEFVFLTFVSYRVARLFFTIKNNAITSAVFYSILYAISDEIHQIFVFSREGKVIDVGIDSIGIIIAVIFLFILGKYSRKQTAL